jgi:toxin CcdB
MQFDVYRNKSANSKERFPYFLDVQTDLLSELETRMIIPCSPRETYGNKTITMLMPTILIKGKAHIAVTYQMAGIAKRELGPVMDNVKDQRQEIIAAIDLLITGV